MTGEIVIFTRNSAQQQASDDQVQAIIDTIAPLIVQPDSGK